MRAVLTLAAIFLVFSPTLGFEKTPWPQFRGPGGSGVAEKQTPPLEIGPDRNVKWRIDAPSGFSSPIVVGKLLVITAFEDGKLWTVAYDRANGRETWRVSAPAKKIEPYHQTEGSPAASTPTTDGERIVSYFGSCGLFCYDLSGKELWRYEMPTAATPFDFGTGVSPVLADGRVVLVRDENLDPKTIAVDLKSGKLIWETKRESKSGYCTPVVFDAPGGKQFAVGGFGRMIGYDLASGKEAWTVQGMPAATCATAVVSEGRLYFAGWSPGEDMKLPSFDAFIAEAGETELGYVTKQGSDKTMLKGFFANNDLDHDGKLTRKEWDEILKIVSTSKNSAFALELGGSGNVTDSRVIWRQKKGLPYVPSGILYQGQYVLLKDGGIVTAYDAKTGDEIYTKRAAANGRYYSSPVAANGNIYMIALDDGAVTVIKAGGKTPEVAFSGSKFDDRVAATPAIADNEIYVRTAGKIYAFAHSK